MTDMRFGCAGGTARDTAGRVISGPPPFPCPAPLAGRLGQRPTHHLHYDDLRVTANQPEIRGGDGATRALYCAALREPTTLLWRRKKVGWPHHLLPPTGSSVAFELGGWWVAQSLLQKFSTRPGRSKGKYTGTPTPLRPKGRNRGREGDGRQGRTPPANGKNTTTPPPQSTQTQSQTNATTLI